MPNNNNKLPQLRPQANAVVRIQSRHKIGGQIAFLSAIAPGTEDGVGLSVDTATNWSLWYDAGRASYVIWRDGTTEVLDASGTKPGYVTTCGSQNADNQRWAIRAQAG